jgi:hypothetical protein
MTNRCTEDSFLKDVATHHMTVIRDDGVHRHLKFRRPGTYCMGFDLVTWPGYLCFSGDMGCFVFQRLEDMFEFFRTRPCGQTGLYINLRYWGEKIQAESRYGGFKAFSEDLFRQAVTEYLDDAEASPELRQEVEDEVMSRIWDGEHAACQAVYDFEYQDFRFQDFFERDFKEYTYHFIWCCYALAWGIQQYDQACQVVSP